VDVAVVALGKIGLPLAVQFALKGARVIGCDVNVATVDAVNAGVEPFPEEFGLKQSLHEVVARGRLTATTQTQEAVRGVRAVVVVVPLVVDEHGSPDFGAMDAATRAIAAGITPGTLVSYETTLPVGTTRNRFAPLLEKVSGLTAGRDFHLAFSPERVLTGRVFADLRRYPKLVGGYTATCGEVARVFYESLLDFDDRPDLPRPNGVWNLGTCEASELAKLAETTYRDVNIGLVNQFAKFASTQGIDIYKVIEASNSQPYSHLHQPGIAVGGHCIPIYPQMYLWNDPNATIVRAAREANRSMPMYAIELLEAAHGSLSGQSVAVFGASYRGGVKEIAFSGVFAVVEELRKRGAIVSVHDPLYSDLELRDLGFTPFHYGDTCDAAVLQAEHREYVNLPQSPGTCRTLRLGRSLETASTPKHLKIVRLS